MMYSTYLGILVVALQCSHVLGDCRHGWLQHGIMCYYFSEKSKDWTSASASCRAHGAELVIIESQAENDFIAGLVKRLKGGFWLDGTDEFSEGTWEWASTGQAMDYTHWFPGEPTDSGNDEDCLVTHDTYPNGEWNDERCSTPNKYICERKSGETAIGK